MKIVYNNVMWNEEYIITSYYYLSNASKCNMKNFLEKVFVVLQIFPKFVVEHLLKYQRILCKIRFHYGIVLSYAQL